MRFASLRPHTAFRRTKIGVDINMTSDSFSAEGRSGMLLYPVLLCERPSSAIISLPVESLISDVCPANRPTGLD